MTVSMNDAGMVELPENVRRLFHLETASQLELEVREDAIMLRPERNIPYARIVRKGNRLIIAGDSALSDHDIVEVIRADREERADRILAFREDG